MTFDWHKVSELAEALASCDDEAALRSAVSRAYYALYCEARDRAGLNTGGLRDYSHQTVFQYYAGRKNPKLRNLGVNDLPGLFRHRKNADYREDITINKGTAAMVVQKSKKLLADLDKFKPEEIGR